MFTKIYKQDPDFLPGKAMGEIDKMSRMEDDETIDSIRIQRECPSLLPSLKIDMSSNPLIDEIFQICNPSNQIDHEKEHFNAFDRIHTILVKLIS